MLPGQHYAKTFAAAAHVLTWVGLALPGTCFCTAALSSCSECLCACCCTSTAGSRHSSAICGQGCVFEAGFLLLPAQSLIFAVSLLFTIVDIISTLLKWWGCACRHMPFSATAATTDICLSCTWTLCITTHLPQQLAALWQCSCIAAA